MSRRLILILNDGGRENHLPGVEIDAQNYLDFFHLPEAGLWGNGEIQVYRNNCSLEILHSYILQARHNDLQYVVIVFCGHGYSNRLGTTFFELSPGNDASLPQIRDVVRETRCLMIADSCRVVYLAEGGRLRNVRMFSADQSAEAYRRDCFQLYDNAFRALSRGHFTIGMAASLNQTAGEDDNGGYYSRALLTKARDLVRTKRITRHTSDEYNPIANFSLVHSLVCQSFAMNHNMTQTPDLEVPDGRQAPFVVVAP